MGWFSRLFGTDDTTAESGVATNEGDDSSDLNATNEPDAGPVTPLLERLTNERDVPGALPEEATIRENFTETIQGEGQSKLTVNESESESVLPVDTYEEAVEKRVPRAERYDHTPSDFSETVVGYIRVGDEAVTCKDCDGERMTDCQNCSGGQYQCRTCDGTCRRSCKQCGGNQWYDCPECEGSGKTVCSVCGGDSWTECSICGGASEKPCPDCSNGERECSSCDGDGALVHTSQEQCSRCNGSGTHRCPDHQEIDEDCQRCNESGMIDCLHCDGEGIKETDVREPCPECSGASTVECKTCDGNQIVDCTACNGVGGSHCSHCSGEETKDCSDCDGDGQLECKKCDQHGRIECLKCDEDGLAVCRICDGDGMVTCSTCEGCGETVTTKGGRLEFELSMDQGPDFTPRKIRPVWLKDSDGEEVDRELLVSNDPKNAASIVRWADRVWEVNVHYVRCEHGGKTYEVLDVDGDLRYEVSQ